MARVSYIRMRSLTLTFDQKIKWLIFVLLALKVETGIVFSDVGIKKCNVFAIRSVSVTIYNLLIMVNTCVTCPWDSFSWNLIGGIIVSVAHCGFEPQSSPTKHFKIGFCCFSIKHTALRANTVWLGIRIMCPEWSDMSTHRLLFQWPSTITGCQATFYKNYIGI